MRLMKVLEVSLRIAGLRGVYKLTRAINHGPLGSLAIQKAGAPHKSFDRDSDPNSSSPPLQDHLL